MMETPESISDVPPPRRKTFPRKGHTKSRKGCYNCKRRKIKCQETRPSCSNCEKADLQCQYPDVSSRWSSIPGALVVQQPTSSPTVFNLEDLHFFHHFMVRAYPHLPVGADSLWQGVIPAFAHQHDFLIHSMLALAASHLSMNGQGDYRSAALQHRVEAVRLLNESLSRGPTSQADADAKLATCLALTFQSSYMEDGFYDFLTMIRGCALVTQDHSLEAPNSAFHCFSGENHGRTMQDRLREMPVNEIDPKVLDAAILSLDALKPLCEGKPRMKEYRKLLVDIIMQTYHSPLQAYFTFCESYNWPSRLESAEFADFINPENQIGQLLLSHFVALQLLQQCSADFVWSERDTAPPWTIITAWLYRIDEHIGPELKEYNSWPLKIGEAFENAIDDTELKLRLGPVNVRVQSPTAMGSPRNFSFDINRITEIIGVDADIAKSFPM